MTELAALILTIAWAVPACLRSWRMGRFYQIEEYMPRRFLRWLLAKRERWFPRRPALAMLGGIVASALLQVLGAEFSLLHFAIWLAVCAIASQPEPLKETKKAFIRTPRALRLMAAAFVVNGLLIGVASISAIDMRAPQMLSTVSIIGFVGFLFSPVALVVGNLLMFPVEEMGRDRFRKAAKTRLQAANVTTIGITGSYGKTSTKTYLAHLLTPSFKTYPTPKSFNTEMGVSRAINEDLDPQAGYQYFIAEMGAYVPGEIRRICKLTQPTISVVTAVGPMHLERFGTIENIVKAKYEIVENLPPDGIAFFNGDDWRVRGMAERGYPSERVLVSQEGLPQARYQASNLQQGMTGLQFDMLDTHTGDQVAFQTPLIGLHNVTNILLASAVAHHLGVSLATIAERVRTLESADHRLRVNALPNGITIIDDAYSANPVGAVNALAVLNLNQNGRRIVITPGMVELGPLQDEENFKLGQKLTETATDIVLVGIEQTRPLQRGVASTSFDPARLLVVDTFSEARDWFQGQVRAGDAVLFLNDLPDTYL
jgi:UDP-N-acetylmuramoyl-tripeptide--D-alanyl-D-alanine ligase